MPRKKLLYTHEFPYHIRARANNKEWFYLPMPLCWKIFAEHLNEAQRQFNFKVHLFVLMNNHYHMLATCSEKHNLGEVMSWLQKAVSRAINKRTGRINHVFGGPYRASVIFDPLGYSKVYKYVARNPIAAGMVRTVQRHPFSTLNSKEIVTTWDKEWSVELPASESGLIEWLNVAMDEEEEFAIASALIRTEFRLREAKSEIQLELFEN